MIQEGSELLEKINLRMIQENQEGSGQILNDSERVRKNWKDSKRINKDSK